MRLKLFLFVFLLLSFVGLVAASHSEYSGNFSIDEHSQDEKQADKSSIVLYLVLWVAGQLVLVYGLGLMLFDEGGVTKAISVVGIANPWIFIAGMVPFFGFFVGLWGYLYLVKFRFDVNYFMAATVVIPIYVYQFVLRTALIG
ncbi:MAG: hypothetical protein ABEK04_02145 [Candidatus Nanohalobium sp.]